MPDYVEHLLISGEGAGKWLAFARSKVGALHARAQNAKISALSQHWSLEGDTVDVAVRVVHDQRYIRIRRKSCPTFASGLAVAIVAPPLSVYPLVPGTARVETTPEGDANPQFSFRMFFPSAADARAQGTSREPIDEPRLARNPLATDQSISVIGGQINTIKGSQYSGEMRKVVQVLQGENEFIPYSPLFGLTHGVWKARDGQRWVIEVTVNGVVAWVMGMCRARTITDAGGKELLDYIPIATPKPTEQALVAAIAAGTFRFLNTADDMRAFYINIPFFPHCGWAFNPDGHEAANVCYTTKGAVYYSLLFKIAIVDGGTGVEDTGPVAATMTIGEEGYLFGIKTVHPKYPDDLGKLHSFDTRAPVGVHSSCPLYCFYDGDELLVARHEFSSGDTLVSEPHACPYPVFCNGETDQDLTSVTVAASAIPSISIGGISTASVSTVTAGGSCRLSLGGIVGADYQDFSVGPTSGESREWTEASFFSRTGIEDRRGSQAVLIVPFYDREAVFITERTHLRVSQGSVFSQSGFVSQGGSRYSTCSEVCNGIPTRCVRMILGGGAQAAAPFPCLTGFGSERFGIVQFICAVPGQWGTEFNTSLQDGAGCAQTTLTCIDKGPGMSSFPAAVDTDNYSFNYIASGGVRRAMPIPATPNELTRFIEDGVVQRMISNRDAFSEQYMISPHVDPTDPPLLFAPTFDYPTGGTFFVGVP